MKFSLFVAALAAIAAVSLVGCGDNPFDPHAPRAIFVHAPQESVLTIGSTVTFSWECKDCGSLKVRYVEAYVGGYRAFTGPLSGSAQWVVGTVDDGRALPGGTLPPGWYSVSFQSGPLELACAMDCPDREAISSPTALNFTLVR